MACSAYVFMIFSCNSISMTWVHASAKHACTPEQKSKLENASNRVRAISATVRLACIFEHFPKRLLGMKLNGILQAMYLGSSCTVHRSPEIHGEVWKNVYMACMDYWAEVVDMSSLYEASIWCSHFKLLLQVLCTLAICSTFGSEFLLMNLCRILDEEMIDKPRLTQTYGQLYFA